MTSDMTCIFCRIINSQITALVLHQNDHAVALLDAFPLSVGHTLVIPKIHYPKLQDMDIDSTGSVFSLVRKICAALEKAVNVKSTTIAIHNGREAGQEIPHVHVHIVPRTELDGAGPIHTMFKRRPALNAGQLDLIYRNIKNLL
ncbi:MAG TPA: HIT family protein [Nitrososphaeraceae archaeon]|jgi:histidine triad (HIT) family protein